MTGEPADSNPPKKRGRPFQKGTVPNPAGRPKGSGHVAYKVLDAIGQDGAEKALRAVVAAAGAGDLRAAEILLSRCWPARKGRPVQLDIPPLRTAADLVIALGTVAEAVAGGDLTAEEGQAVAAVLETQRRALETLDLAERIAAIEARQPQ